MTSPTPQSGPSQRLVVLDLLRCLAILLVLGSHMYNCPEETSAFVHEVVKVWRRGGWVGVDLFLVLSGFLVSGLIFREHKKTGRVRIRAFLIRRGFKIYPAFWVLIAFSTFIPLAFGGDVDATAVIAELLFIQNYIPGLWDHTWSLGLEEQFYLLLAFYALWAARRARRSGRDPFAGVPRLFAVFAVLCLIIRLGVALTTEYSSATYRYGIHIRIDSFLCGVFVAWLWHTRDLAKSPRLARWAPFLGPVGLALFIPAFVVPLGRNWIPVVGLSMFYLGGAGLLLAGLNSHQEFSRLARGLARIGEYSYSIYLWHLPMNYWIVPYLLKQSGIEVTWFVYANTYFFGSIVLGIVTAKLIEVPMLRLRDRLVPRTVRAVGP